MSNCAAVDAVASVALSVARSPAPQDLALRRWCAAASAQRRPPHAAASAVVQALAAAAATPPAPAAECCRQRCSQPGNAARPAAVLRQPSANAGWYAQTLSKCRQVACCARNCAGVRILSGSASSDCETPQRLASAVLVYHSAPSSVAASHSLDQFAWLATGAVPVLLPRLGNCASTGPDKNTCTCQSMLNNASGQSSASLGRVPSALCSSTPMTAALCACAGRAVLLSAVKTDHPIGLLQQRRQLNQPGQLPR